MAFKIDMKDKRKIIRWLVKILSGKEIFFDDELYKFQKPPAHLHNIIDKDYGHLKTLETGSCIDKNGNSIPWFTYPAIEYLSQFDLSNLDVLEWGSGNSSDYFSKRCNAICSVEHNPDWYAIVKAKILANHTIILADENTYALKATEFGRLFDIIVIDGIERESCCNQALLLLKNGGIIILDNSERHPNNCADFRKKGFLQVDFHGFGPVGLTTWTTSFFFSTLIGLKPSVIQPVIPIGGISNK